VWLRRHRQLRHYRQRFVNTLLSGTRHGLTLLAPFSGMTVIHKTCRKFETDRSRPFFAIYSFMH
jgi:hypothetical protein